jgi:hypothetical protein
MGFSGARTKPEVRQAYRRLDTENVGIVHDLNRQRDLSPVSGGALRNTFFNMP